MLTIRSRYGDGSVLRLAPQTSHVVLAVQDTPTSLIGRVPLTLDQIEELAAALTSEANRIRRSA